MVLKSLLFAMAMFQVVGGGLRNLPIGGGGSCSGVSGTHRDCFTSNPLSANWTSGTASGYVAMVSTGTGNAHPTTSGQPAYMVYTGATWGTIQQSQVIFNTWTNAGASGPMVRMNVAGDGFLYVVSARIVIDINAGSGIATVVSGCPVPVDADVYQLSISGGNLTCTDVTAGTFATAAGITAHPSGIPGVLVDQRSSTSIVVNKWGGS